MNLIVCLFFVTLVQCATLKRTVTRPSPPTDVYISPKEKAAIEVVNDACKNYTNARYRINRVWGTLDMPDTVVSNLDCVKVQELVTGGSNAKPKEFPHMALIGYGKLRNEIDWKCGGSLISEQFVMSAAHCNAQSKPNWVRLGELNTAAEVNPHRMDYRIIKIIDHPKYKSGESYHDITLYKLDKRIRFTPYIRPICLFTKDMMSLPGNNKTAVTGWGLTAPGEAQSDHLQKATINFVSKTKCEQIYTNTSGGFSQGFQAEFAICAGSNTGKDTCQGDSGGPLQILYPKQICMYLQVGITSYGKQECGDPDFPAVYTRVSTYIEWIQENVWPK